MLDSQTLLCPGTKNSFLGMNDRHPEMQSQVSRLKKECFKLVLIFIHDIRWYQCELLFIFYLLCRRLVLFIFLPVWPVLAIKYFGSNNHERNSIKGYSLPFKKYFSWLSKWIYQNITQSSSISIMPGCLLGRIQFSLFFPNLLYPLLDGMRSVEEYFLKGKSSNCAGC